MNKQEIFSLYVGKCKVRHFANLTDINSSYDYGFNGYKEFEGKAEARLFYPNKNEVVWFNIINCQLILKRLSKMSKEDNAEFEKVLIPFQFEKNLGIYAGTNHYHLALYANRVTLWLIQHGYALSDEWFLGKNPIAVEE